MEQNKEGEFDKVRAPQPEENSKINIKIWDLLKIY